MFVPLPFLILAGGVLVLAIAAAFRPLRCSGSDLIAPPQQSVRPVLRQPDVPITSVPLMPDLEARVRELIRAGRVIEAVKLARDATGLGLKDAKDLVDRMR